MKLKWILLAVCLFFLGVFIFWAPIVSQSSEWVIHWYAHHKLGGDLSYTSFESQPGKFIFHDPYIQKKNNTTLAAKSLSIEYVWDWPKKELTLQVLVDNLNVKWGEKTVDLHNLFHRTRSSSWLNVNGQLTVEKGNLQLLRPERSIPSAIVSFSGSLKWGKDPEGKFEMSFGAPHDYENLLKAEFLQEKEGPLNVHLAMQQVPASEAVDLANAFWPQAWSWQAQQGTVNGDIRVEVPVLESPIAKGSLIIDELKIKHPQLGIHASIGQASLHVAPLLHQGDVGSFQRSYIPQCTGVLEVSQPSSLVFEQEGEVFGRVKELQGKVCLSTEQAATFDLQGDFINGTQKSKVFIRGGAHQDFGLLIRVEHPNQDVASARVALKNYASEETPVELNFQGISNQEYSIVQRFLQAYAPQFHQIILHNGAIDAKIKGTLSNQKMSDLSVESFLGQHVLLEVPAWDILVGAEQLNGHGAISLNIPHPIETLNGELNIQNGFVKLVGINQEFWQFNNVQTKLLIHQGVIQDSTASVEWAGLKGNAQLNWTAAQEVMQLSLSGQAKDLHKFVPSLVQKAILSEFHDDHLAVMAKFYRRPGGVRVNGDLLISSPLDPLGDKIAFGFDLDKKTSAKPEKALGVSQQEELYWKSIFPSFVRMMAPHFSSGSSMQNASWYPQEFNFGDIALRNGWFSAAHIAFKKYVTPLIFPEGNYDLVGSGDINGNFDLRELVVRYNAQDLSLENDELAIQVPIIHGSNSTGPEGNFKAFHYFDLLTNNDFGFLPVTNGSYLDKNTGLLFTDIDAEILFEDKKIHITNFESYCQGVFIGAQIEIDNTPPGKGAFDLKITSEVLYGKVSQFKEILAKFPAVQPYINIPLEGNISYRDKGGKLELSFRPDVNVDQFHIQGSIVDGEMTCENVDLAIRDLSMNFEYDDPEHLLEFTDLHGSVLLGSPKHAEEYALSSERISFSDFSRNQGVFDLSIKDKTQEVFHVSGYTEPLDGAQFAVHFDKDRTHFGDIYPSKMALLMRDFSTVDLLEMELQFRLSSLVHDLQKFTPSGFPFLSRHLLGKLDDLSPIGGEMNVKLNYSSQTSRTSFIVNGRDVTLKTHHYKQVVLEGNKRDSNWVIDTLQLDDLNLAADLTKNNENWLINFLGGRYGKSLLVGLEGQFNEDTDLFRGHINLLEINFAHTQDWKSLPESIIALAPKGQFRGTGEITIDKLTSGESSHFDTILNGSLKECSLNGFSVGDADHISCRYTTGDGITLQNINTEITALEDPNRLLTLQIEKLDLDTNPKAFSLEGTHFKIEAEHLPWLASTLNEFFPGELDQETIEFITSLKKQGMVKGMLFFEHTPSGQDLKIHLGDGVYTLFGGEHSLQDFVLEKGQGRFKVITRYRFNQYPFWLTAISSHPTFDEGQVIFNEANPLYTDPSLDPDPLIIDWIKHPVKGLSISKAVGEFCGLKVNLKEDSSNPSTDSVWNLSGIMQINAFKARSLLSPEWVQKLVDWKAGRGYILNGYWQVNKNTLSDGGRDFSFDGELQGRNVELKGYVFQNLGATVKWDPGYLSIDNLMLSDAAGTLTIEQIRQQRDDQGRWHFNIPLITVQKFKPSLLREQGNSTTGPVKPLIIDELHIQDIKGVAGQETTFVGSGRLHFLNQNKNNLQNTILALPAEILNRIGLNIGVLTPAQGTVIFHLQDGKVILSKFKDMYSENKLSKFYLTNSHESHMDLEGNLHLQVRMKQYNLLFKLAELFTVTVEGSIFNPHYNLQKQSHDGAKEHQSAGFGKFDNF